MGLSMCVLWAVYVRWGPEQQLDGVHMSVDRVFVKFIPPELCCYC